MPDTTRPLEPQDSPEQDARKDEPPPPESLPEQPEKILKKIPIASGHILNVSYDPLVNAMFVEFVNGSRYKYENVDPTVFTAFMDAPSKGNYLHKVIRQVCPCEKLP
jgi:hypothetical protein